MYVAQNLLASHRALAPIPMGDQQAPSAGPKSPKPADRVPVPGRCPRLKSSGMNTYEKWGEGGGVPSWFTSNTPDYALLLRSFADHGNSSRFPSTVCALFAKIRGVYPGRFCGTPGVYPQCSSLFSERFFPISVNSVTLWLSVSSPFRHAIQIFVERGERHTRTFRVANRRWTFGRECGNGTRHRDAMIAVRLDFGAAQFSGGAAGDFQSVRTLFHRRAHPPQILNQHRDAVAFFYAQFAGVANFNSLFRVRAKRGEHRQFINHERNRIAGNYAAFQRGAFHGEVADHFAMRALHGLNLNARAHLREHVQNRSSRRIQSDILNQDARLRKKRSCGDEKDGRGNIARHIEIPRRQSDQI